LISNAMPITDADESNTSADKVAVEGERPRLHCLKTMIKSVRRGYDRAMASNGTMPDGVSPLEHDSGGSKESSAVDEDDDDAPDAVEMCAAAREIPRPPSQESGEEAWATWGSPATDERSIVCPNRYVSETIAARTEEDEDIFESARRVSPDKRAPLASGGSRFCPGDAEEARAVMSFVQSSIVCVNVCV
jgi:hypothetical protein